MQKITNHNRCGSCETDATARELFEVLRNTANVPRWFYRDRPIKRVQLPTRKVLGDEWLETGARFLVESTDEVGLVNGRELILTPATVDTFTCTELVEGSSVRLEHFSTVNSISGGHYATMVTILEVDRRRRRRVTVCHESTVVGSGVSTSISRMGRKRFSNQVVGSASLIAVLAGGAVSNAL